MRIQITSEFNAEVGKVFEAFTNIEKIADRIEAIDKVIILEGENPAKVGTKWEETRKMMGKELYIFYLVTEHYRSPSLVSRTPVVLN